MNIKDEKKQPLLNLPLEQKKKMLVMQNKNKTESGKFNLHIEGVFMKILLSS